jgi:SAM-dependent methyltransferase
VGSSRYDAFNEYERTMWSSPRAGAYDEGVTALTASTAGDLLDALDATGGVRLLDLGTGPGVVAALATRRGCAVVGVDVSPQMLELAARRVPDAEFRTGSAEAVPAGDGEFDAVAGNFVVLHLGHPERAAAEAARVLRLGGRVAFTVWAAADRNRVLGVFPDALARSGVAAPADIPEGPDSWLFADHDRFRALLAGARFEDVEVRELAWTHTVDPAAWWDAIVASTPRTGALIARQPERVQAELRAAYDAIVAEYAQPDGRVALPARAVLATATLMRQ